MQRPEDVYRRNRSQCQLWRHVVSNAGEAKNLDVKRFTDGLNGLQVLAGVTSKPELKLAAGDRLLDRIVMAVKQVANGCPDKIGTVGVEPFLYKEIDMTQVNIADSRMDRPPT